MRKYLGQFIRIYKQVLVFIKTDDFFALLTLSPFYFSWLPILTWKYKDYHLRILSYYSAINLIVFLSFLLIANILSWLPMLGTYLSNFFHFIAILTYLGFSGFLIYLVSNQKKIEIPYVSLVVTWFDYFIEENPKANAPIAQLDRASDYGSEGWRFKSFWAHKIL